MARYFISTRSNKIGVVDTDPDTGTLVKMTMYPSGPTREDAGKNSTATEWIVRHPKTNLLVSLTSYWNKHPAHLNLFRVEPDGLAPLTVEKSTGARQAAYGVFAPTPASSDKVCLAIAHHNDGFISFFQMDAQGPPTSLMDQPTMTLELPVVVEPYQKKVLEANQKVGLSLPACHHVFYPPHGKYAIMVDSTQSVLFTYATDPDTGLPTNPENEPSSVFHCQTEAHPLGWVSGIVNKVLRLGCRPRRVALSPNGEYIYISYELRNAIQVYAIDPETGKLDPNNQGCLQEISTLSQELNQHALIGLSVQASAEMIVVRNFLYVSNRGWKAKVIVGRSENSVRVFEIQDGGRLVTATAQTLTCDGPVRHFCVYESGEYEILVAGTCSAEESNLGLQTFRRANKGEGQYELVGTAQVGVHVMCVLPVRDE